MSRTRLKNYQAIPDRLTVLLDTKSNHTIRLRSVTANTNTDYYLEVQSPAKERKEEGMKLQFEKRFEAELQKIKASIHSKGGIKKSDKVHQRIGRAKEKYPSVQQYYVIEVTEDKKTHLVTNISWKKEVTKHDEKVKNLGIYFLPLLSDKFSKTAVLDIIMCVLY